MNTMEKMNKRYITEKQVERASLIRQIALLAESKAIDTMDEIAELKAQLAVLNKILVGKIK